jgi:hypothetical protein
MKPPTYTVELRPLPDSPIDDARQLARALKAMLRDKGIAIRCVDVREAGTERGTGLSAKNHAKPDFRLDLNHAKRDLRRSPEWCANP